MTFAARIVPTLMLVATVASAVELPKELPDFSHCGYMSGGVPIPAAPIVVVVTRQESDATLRIQAALDHVATLPLNDNGIRGAVLLEKGRYEIAGALRISTSGLVLRGSGAGADGTTLHATGHDRRTLITMAGKDDRKLDAPVEITDDAVPLGATRFHAAGAKLNKGDTIQIRRPCTANWIKTLGMDNMGGERHGFTWRPGSRELVWDRTITAINGDEITIDAPITTALEKSFGGGTVTKYTWPGRISNVGVENIRLESAFDSSNPKDESHAWFAITMESVRDAWVRQVNFAHFAGSAVASFESSSRITIEECKSLAPISELAGWRRHTFFTSGQQNLFQRCYCEQGRHDFSVGFCAPGPNAFVQCEAKEALDDSGPIDSWASGVLFDNVRIDGNAIAFADRRFNAQGAGWSAANSVIWQSSAAVIRLFSPPTARNWAFGCWASFDGNGEWVSCNESVEPFSLYYAQLKNRLGDRAMKDAHLLEPLHDASSSPSVQEAAEIIATSKKPAPQLSDWIDSAAKRNPIPTSIPSSGCVSDPAPVQKESIARSRKITLTNGTLAIDSKPLTGSHQSVMWWRGTIRPPQIDQNTPCITRFVPGRYGRGWTDDLDDLAASMLAQNKITLEHNYGLWYDRRSDDHERVRRMNGDAWPPFYELPFSRSGSGVAWDGLSKYDLTKFNPWYFDRLNGFATLADQRGLVLINNHFFQHNILEAGAHWSSCPWRSANNINDTGFPEPPPYAGDKRIFMAEQFYDVTHATRARIYRGLIRKNLDALADRSNVIHLTSAEFTGPLDFVQFWLDTIAEWEKETGKHALIGLSATKDVQDAILADRTRAAIVDVIDIRYWHYQADGSAYAPRGGQNLAPRQHARLLKPRPTSAEQVTRAVREYREKFPEKAVIYSADGADKFGDAVLKAGGSLAEVRR